MTAYNYQTFENVPSAADQLSNIGVVAQANGWVIDKNDIASNGELYLHSTGLNGNQNLFFSFKIRTACDSSRQLLVWHCNTGFDTNLAWDDQPGRFSTCIYPGENYAVANPPYDVAWSWQSYGGDYASGTKAYWILPNCPKQLIFANGQNIISVQRIVETVTAEGQTFVGYVAFVIGAMDSQTPTTETELNFTLTDLWGQPGALGLMFDPYVAYPIFPSSNEAGVNYTYGFLYGGENAMTNLPTIGAQHYPETTFGKKFYTSIGEHRKFGADKYVYPFVYRYPKKSQLGPDYTNILINNPGMARTILHKPFVYVEDSRTEYHYFYPTRASLPYYACGFYPYLKGEQIVSYGSRNFMVFPWTHDKCDLGMAIEVNTT